MYLFLGLLDALGLGVNCCTGMSCLMRKKVLDEAGGESDNTHLPLDMFAHHSFLSYFHSNCIGMFGNEVSFRYTSLAVLIMIISFPSTGISAFGIYLAEDYFFAKYIQDRGFGIRIASQPAWQNAGNCRVKTFLSRLTRYVTLDP